jgi:hypothetical protein
MVSLVVPTAAATLPTPNASIRWIAPAPKWDAPGSVFHQPFLAEFTEDSFMPDFLNMMAGNTQLNLIAPHQQVKNLHAYKLFQPLHKCYYLVTASLVCRKVGLPDRTVDRKNGEKVSFVLRRLVPQTTPPGQPQQYTEMAWVNEGDNKGWQFLEDKQHNPVPIRKDEERLPLHAVKYCPFVDASASSTGGSSPSKPCDPRTVYHGYIPVDKREKYLASYSITAIQNYIASSGVDPRLDQVTTQVIDQWRALYVDPITGEALSDGQDLRFEQSTSPTLHNYLAEHPEEQKRRLKLRQQISLYLILDLADFLNTYLSNVFNAITTNSPIQDSNQQALYSELDGIQIDTNTTVTGRIKLTDAINKLQTITNPQNSVNLSNAESDPPIDTYDVAYATYSSGSVDQSYLALPPPPSPPANPLPAEGPLHKLFSKALATSTTQFAIPPDLASLVKNEPAQGDIFITRLVYERGICDPVISQPSAHFTFAKIHDTDAPARKIRIEMPSIGLKDLRKHKRGVAFQLPPDLNNLLNRVNPGMLKGGGLADAGAPLGIAMICTFSIPIITICALIVLFIFLILLNIIFWWLPFIRICFPIPESK